MLRSSRISQASSNPGSQAFTRNESRLLPVDVKQFQSEFKEFCGPSRFRRFVEVVHLGRRQQQRLRYWQERILTAFTERFSQYCGMTVLDIIAALEVCHIHDRPLVRDRVPAAYGDWRLPMEFMKARSERFPYGSTIYYGDSVEVERLPTREVLACPDCRAELERWNHGRKRPLGVPPPVYSDDNQCRSPADDTPSEAMGLGEKFWPFPIDPGCELTRGHTELIRFLDTAFRDGLCPSEHRFGFTVRSPDKDREAHVIRRRPSIDWWELILFEQDPAPRVTMSGFVTGFATITALAMQWVRGADADEMRSELAKFGTQLKL
jgi:hypothetical protein